MMVLLIGPIMVAGCTQPEGDDGDDFLATFATDWSADGSDYFVTVEPEAPEDWRVVVTEVDSGVNQEIDGDALTERAGGKMSVPSELAVRAGKTYRIEGFVGDDSIGSREIEAVDVPVGDPWGAEVEAEYRGSARGEDTTEDDSTVMSVEGAAIALEATEDSLTRRVTGQGTMETENPTFRMTLDITRYEQEEVDDELTAALMSGAGTWTSTDPTVAGSGDIDSFRSEFLGRDDKEDGDGREHLTEKFENAFEMSGTMRIEGETVQMEASYRNITWSRVDNGVTIWDRGESTFSFTYQGEGFTQANSSDGPIVNAEEGAPAMLDVFDFTGVRPATLMPGDRFTAQGLEDVEIQYTVEDAAARTVSGASYETVKVIGSITSGATGTETWFVVRDAPLAGLALASDTEFEHERGSLRTSSDIVSIA